MKKPARGRPRTSPLTRAEQLRAAKRAQRQRLRGAGLTEVQLRLPASEATRLRAAANAPHFRKALDGFLQGVVVDIEQWPRLRELAWNRADRWIPAEEALALYERNWRFVQPNELTAEEAALVDRLKQQFGGGVVNA
ncbi:MAG TPA: hypothetical protein VMU47_22605 [Caldimonas sp.]|nr:hypothetical protein [Caldimonas sp.]